MATNFCAIAPVISAQDEQMVEPKYSMTDFLWYFSIAFGVTYSIHFYLYMSKVQRQYHHNITPILVLVSAGIPVYGLDSTFYPFALIVCIIAVFVATGVCESVGANYRLQPNTWLPLVDFLVMHPFVDFPLSIVDALSRK